MNREGEGWEELLDDLEEERELEFDEDKKRQPVVLCKSPAIDRRGGKTSLKAAKGFGQYGAPKI